MYKPLQLYVSRGLQRLVHNDSNDHTKVLKH